MERLSKRSCSGITLLYNLTTNISEALNPYPLSLDFQFVNELDNFISNGNGIVRL